MRLSHLCSALTLIALSATAVAADTKAVATDKLPSGVIVAHTQLGKGPQPTENSTVKVHYRGYFADGKEFDSSYKRGEPTSFPLRHVIPCWTQGIQKLKEGGKATLTCPGPTAYGPNGIAGVIPPNATLYFDVELLSAGQ
jgi:FKBP-type peptidyl-prolyl cis-trans isomerase FkpA